MDGKRGKINVNANRSIMRATKIMLSVAFCPLLLIALDLWCVEPFLTCSLVSSVTVCVELDDFADFEVAVSLKERDAIEKYLKRNKNMKNDLFFLLKSMKTGLFYKISYNQYVHS